MIQLTKPKFHARAQLTNNSFAKIALKYNPTPTNKVVVMYPQEYDFQI